jgi:hypothetical protein
MTKLSVFLLAGTVTLALTAPASAAHRDRRSSSDVGPLIMSGTMVPGTSLRRRRDAEICRPVTIRVWPQVSSMRK